MKKRLFLKTLEESKQLIIKVFIKKACKKLIDITYAELLEFHGFTASIRKYFSPITRGIYGKTQKES